MAENDGAQMHSILLEEREKLRVTGVSDVQSFDEEQVLLETGKGMLIVALKSVWHSFLFVPELIVFRCRSW